MPYVYLAIAIVGEVIGTSLLKTSDGMSKLWPTCASIVAYAVTFYFLSLTLRTIPTGIAYAIWSHSGHPSASTATSPSLTPTAPSSSAPKRRVRAPPPKNCSCEWCGATFTKSGLGRHYDQWVYAVSPARPDEKHTEEAILRMRELRSDVRRLRGMKHMDPKEKKSLQNRRNYERHQEQQVEKKRVKRIADMARSMVFKELAKEVEEM